MALPMSRAATTDEDQNDIEDAGSYLLPFGLESVGKSRSYDDSAAAKRKKLIITGSVLGGLATLALVLGLTLGLRHGNSMESLHYACPSDLELAASTGVFFVVGDWGRANSNQRLAARMMADVADCMKPHFIISTGDNFYPHGLGSAQDPQFQDSFTDIYNATSLETIPWYSVLGNHDYGDTLSDELLSSCPSGIGLSLSECKPGCCYSPLWQVPSDPATRNSSINPRWHQQQGAHVMNFSEYGLDIIFIDTTPFMPKYEGHAWSHVIGGYASQDTAQQQAEVERLLNSSTAPLKMVVGHHPVRSFGEHCDVNTDGANDCDVMSMWLKPLLLKYNVLAYLCGHEHGLQYIKVPGDPVHYVVSGAGSDVRMGEFDDVIATAGSVFLLDDQGFVAVVVNEGEVTLYYYASHSSQPVLIASLSDD